MSDKIEKKKEAELTARNKGSTPQKKKIGTPKNKQNPRKKKRLTKSAPCPQMINGQPLNIQAVLKAVTE